MGESRTAAEGHAYRRGHDAGVAAERARWAAIVTELGQTHFGTANANLILNRALPTEDET